MRFTPVRFGMKNDALVERKPNNSLGFTCSQQGFSTKTFQTNTSKSQIINLASLIDVLQKNQVTSKSQYGVQARAIQIQIPMPQTNQGKISDHVLKSWVTEVTNTVISSAFHYYENQELSYEQTKVFCSEKILKNIARLYQKYSLSSDELHLIDNHLQKGVIPHMLTNYPMSQSIEVNKTLEQAVKEVNDIENFRNSYLFDSDIVFEHRKSGNYNDLIMRVVNDVIGRIEYHPPLEKNKSTFSEFKNLMESVFEKVYDMDWMSQKQEDASKTQDNVKGSQLMGEAEKEDRIRKQKYKNEVKEYTHYMINRKIPQNITLYSAKQIQSKNMHIRHPSVLRILTKWCEELLEKFTTRNYYLIKEPSVQLIKGGSTPSLEDYMKAFINKEIQEEGRKIDEFMKDTYENNYMMQSSLMELELKQEGDQHINFLEKVCGKFAIKTVNNLHTYILTYLNRLIHGLTTVSSNFQKSFNLSISSWPYPPNLVSFRIGDLVRCKCSSKEKEILKIYKELWRLSRDHPEKFKILRIKNRLRNGTNDIMMNVKFNGMVLGEIQLAVQSKETKFIQHSTKYNHFLYELQRSLFGPITELCSIWRSLDQRMRSYQKIVDQQKRKMIGIQENSKEQDFKPFYYPFICNECNFTFYHDNYVKNHLKRRSKNYWRCALCQISSQSSQNLVRSLITDGLLAKNCLSRYTDPNKEFPAFGAAIFIEQKMSKPEMFRIYELDNCKHIIARNSNGNIYEISQLVTNKDVSKFLSKYIVFEIYNTDNKLINITDDQIKKQFILTKKVSEIYKQEKQTISLANQNLFNEDLDKILKGDTKDKLNIKRMMFTKNNLINFRYVAENFPNVTSLEINYNYGLKDFGKMDLLQKLKTICIDGCPSSVVPKQICLIKSLEQMIWSESQIKQLPQDIINWQNLLRLQMDFNQFEELHPNIVKLTTINNINVNGNKIKSLPKGFENLQNLQQLYLGKNQFEQIPDCVFGLKNLKIFYFHENLISKVSSKISNLKNLEVLDLSKNKIAAFEVDFQQLPNIKTVNLSETGLTALPNFARCASLEKLCFNGNHCESVGRQFEDNCKLEILQLRDNKISRIGDQAFKDLRRLMSLDLSGNAIRAIGQWVRPLSSLMMLKAENNAIEQVTSSINHCLNIEKIILSNNRLTQIPETLCNCASLSSLHLQNNLLAEFPAFLEQISALDEVNVGQNRFEFAVISSEYLISVIKGVEVRLRTRKDSADQFR